jgi:hypothetical protein
MTIQKMKIVSPMKDPGIGGSFSMQQPLGVEEDSDSLSELKLELVDSLELDSDWLELEEELLELELELDEELELELELDEELELELDDELELELELLELLLELELEEELDSSQQQGCQLMICSLFSLGSYCRINGYRIPRVPRALEWRSRKERRTRDCSIPDPRGKVPESHKRSRIAKNKSRDRPPLVPQRC